MDNVACYGSESQLLDCTHHTDTSEDVHSEDIWVNCDAKDSSDDSLRSDIKQNSASSTVALTVALAVCLLVIIAGAVYILVRYLKKRKYSPADEW